MEYQIIKTKFGRESIYVPQESMLYVAKGRNDEFVCYQTILTDPKKQDHEKHVKCTARIHLLPNGLCERQNPLINHTFHENHKTIVQDKAIVASVCETVELLKDHLGPLSSRVPNRPIFQNAVSR